MSESIWKKEISFGRKPKVAPEPKAAKESVWKKEVSFSRKRDRDRDREPMPTVELAQDSAEPKSPKPETSIWKKELSFRRKPAADTPSARIDLALGATARLEKPVQPEPNVELVPREQEAVEPEQPQDESELVPWLATAAPVLAPKPLDVEPFSALPEPQSDSEPVAEVEQAELLPPVVHREPAPEPLAPLDLQPAPTEWEVETPPALDHAPEPLEPPHMRLASAPWLAAAEPLPPPTPWDFETSPEPDNEPVAELPVEAEPEPWLSAAERPHVPTSWDVQTSPEPDNEPVAESLVAAEPEPWLSAAEPLPAPTSWDVQMPPALDNEPVAESPVAAEPEPWLSAAEPPPAPTSWDVETPPALDNEPVAESPVAAEPEPWLSAAELPLDVEPVTEHAVQPEPTVLEASLPEAELPSAEPKASFWRKERSLKRTRKEPQRAAVVEPVASAEPKTSFWRKERSLKRATEETKPVAAAEPKTSFLRKERSLKRATEETKPVAAAEPKTSFLRKERSFKRAVKESRAARPRKKLSLKRTPREPKTRSGDSFLRRERSLTKPKMSVPKRASGAAGGSGSHAVKRYVGLKVGSSQIAAARVANNGAAELLQIAREPLAHGVVVNGELRDPEALAEALKRFFARNKLPRKNVRLGIASSRIGVRVFDITGVDDEKQLENAIRFRAQDTLPIPLDEAVLDYHILGETVDEQGNAARRVLLVVAYRDLVDRYVAACRKAGVSLVGIDLEAFALLRALAAPKPADETSDAAFVAVAIGHDRSTFAVSDGRVCEFTRVIEWGGGSLSVALARALDMAPSEVESIKRLVSLESDTVPEGIAAADYARAVEAVHRQVQGFARELVSSLQFYQGQPGSLGIGEIVITGGTANLAGLAGELERQIGVRVRVGDPLARLKVGKKVSSDEQIGSLAVAIGLGIED